MFVKSDTFARETPLFALGSDWRELGGVTLSSVHRLSLAATFDCRWWSLWFASIHVVECAWWSCTSHSVRRFPRLARLRRCHRLTTNSVWRDSFRVYMRLTWQPSSRDCLLLRWGTVIIYYCIVLRSDRRSDCKALKKLIGSDRHHQIIDLTWKCC